jgi:hypothetical protein
MDAIHNHERRISVQNQRSTAHGVQPQPFEKGKSRVSGILMSTIESDTQKSSLAVFLARDMNLNKYNI